MCIGCSNDSRLSLTFLIYLFSFSALVSALDTITSSLQIQEPGTISSNNGMFTLGFFSPDNSTHRYLGIWYMSKSSVVWAANRDEPLADFSGVLTISENGNLVLNGLEQVVWSTKVLHIASNSTAQLLDSGNLVLLDGVTKAMMWQSFQHPCDTLLPGMKLSTYLITGQNVQLTSWKSTSDPSSGEFSLVVVARDVSEIFVLKENHPYFRSGPWNGSDFIGIPRTNSSKFHPGLEMMSEKESFKLMTPFADKSPSTLTLDSQGKVEKRRWNTQANIWEPLRTYGSSECDVYGKCGPFGICNSQDSLICSCLRGFEPSNIEEWVRHDWTSGCTRTEALQCDKNSAQDQFFKLEKVKVPDKARTLPAYVVDDIADCHTTCLKNCHCIAYAYEIGIGCMTWDADLLDIQSFPDGGSELYIRLAGRGRRKIAAPIIISVLIGTTLITVPGYFLWKKCSKKKMQTQNKRRIMHLKQVHIPELTMFGLKQLATATNNFNVENKLGQGGFGPVFKGKLDNGQEITVKRLSRSSRQGMKEFINEVELISKLQHRNLVKLLGCCIEGEEILVYEYMPNKSLDAYIFDPLQRKSFDWGKRCNIIEGIARGLLYLHRDSRLRIIHQDLKASNILLDKEMNPKISDFGMAKLFGGNQDKANTERIVGTYGYISPEYATEGLYSEKFDVFSFGVLLLEIVSGRKNTSFYEEAESLTLLGFAWRLWMDGNVIPVIDPQIYETSFYKDILRCIHIGLLCVQELAKDRPIWHL